MREKRTIRPQIALEMTMRDVLGNMEEMVSEYGFHDMGGEFEILAIEPTCVPDAVDASIPSPFMRTLFSADLYPFPLSA